MERMNVHRTRELLAECHTELTYARRHGLAPWAEAQYQRLLCLESLVKRIEAQAEKEPV